MTTTLIPSKTRLEPTRIAPETFVIHDHAGEGHAPVLVPLNTMVIRGQEPVVVDTGVVENRDQFLADVFSLVEPDDIRWVFISHDDVDHTGNVNALMTLAPNATLIVNWFIQERMGSTLEVSPLRQRWVGDGESIDVGDRKLLAIRPPVYDSPTTRGLFDPTTGVYWSSDSFATPMLTPNRDVCEIPAEMWHGGMGTFNRYISPWIEIADAAKYQKSVDRIAQLGASAIVGCHTPLIGRAHVATAIEATRRSPQAEIIPLPDQSVLDQIQLTLLSGS
jgi:flavorubredoxin